MSQFIAAKSDQLNAEDMLAGPRSITITRVTGNASPEQPVNVWFEGDEGKPWRPCKTTRRILVRVWGADASKYVGRSLTLYRDPKVKFGGLEVGGIRISHMSHMEREETMALMASQKRMQPVTIKPLTVQRAPSKSAPAPAAVEGAAAGGDPTPNDVAAEVVAKFKAAETVEQIDAAWKLTKDDRAWCEAADPTWPDVFKAEFKKAKTALLPQTDEVPA